MEEKKLIDLKEAGQKLKKAITRTEEKKKFKRAVRVSRVGFNELVDMIEELGKGGFKGSELDAIKAYRILFDESIDNLFQLAPEQ